MEIMVHIRNHSPVSVAERFLNKHPDGNYPKKFNRRKVKNASVNARNADCLWLIWDAISKHLKKNDLKQWEKVKILFDYGFTYHSCGCCGPGLRPSELSEVQNFIESKKSKTEGEKLLDSISERVRIRDSEN
jgi:hypothetical protein